MHAWKKKITVLLPNHLGDVVMATPALRALRKGFPEAELCGVIRADLAPILQGGPWFDGLVTHRIHEGPGRLDRLRRRLDLARDLAGSDQVLLLPNSFMSALLALAAGAPSRVGYRRGGRGPLLTEAVDPPRRNGRVVPLAMERYYLDLVCTLGCPDLGTELELYTHPEADKECDELLERHFVRTEGPLVCMAPGAAFGSSKLWPAPYYGEVARELVRDGAQVALVHGPGEEPIADEVMAAAGPGPVSLGGRDMHVSLLKSVLERSSLLLCNDAGARHVAAAFSVPTIVLMGPTSEEYTNLNLSRTRLLREPVGCSPCQRKTCPIDHRCMTRLEPVRVLEQARAALRDPRWEGSRDLELAP